MQVSELLEAKHGRVIAIGPSATVRDVAGVLRQERIGIAMVREADGALVGVISERDIVRGIAERGQAALDMVVIDLMSRSVVTCTPESGIEELMEQMLANRIRHLPVIQDEALVGVVSVNDVMRGVLSELKWRERVLQEQIVTAAGWSTDED